jgi:hypothetical protein
VKRIVFSNGNVSEWFDVDIKLMEKFLKFCDESIFNKIKPNVIDGTYFLKNSSDLIRRVEYKRNLKNIPSVHVLKKTVGYKHINGILKRVDYPRSVGVSSQRYVYSLSQVSAMADHDKRIKERKKNNN